MNKKRLLALAFGLILSFSVYAQSDSEAQPESKGNFFFSAGLYNGIFSDNPLVPFPNFDIKKLFAAIASGNYEFPLGPGNTALGLEVGYSSGSRFGGIGGVDFIPFGINAAYVFPLTNFLYVGPRVRIGGLGLLGSDWNKVVFTTGARLEAELRSTGFPFGLFVAGGIDIFPFAPELATLPVVEVGIRFPRGKLKKSSSATAKNKEPAATNTGGSTDNLSGQNLAATVVPSEPAPATAVPAEPAPGVAVAPAEPVPEESVPEEPVLVAVVPAEPAPTEPVPAEPTPVAVVPEEPALVEAAPEEPTLAEAAPEEPVPAEIALVEAAPEEAVPEEPALVEAAPEEPIIAEAAPEPAPEETAPEEPVHVAVVPAEPAPATPATPPVVLAPVVPAPVVSAPAAPAFVAPQRPPIRGISGASQAQNISVILEDGRQGMLNSIYFEPDTAVLIELYRSVLNAVGRELAADPSLNLVIRAYAADFGTADGRYAVSSSRAVFSRDFLATQYGISANRFSTEVYGADRSPNYATEDWQTHRCVELILVRE